MLLLHCTWLIDPPLESSDVLAATKLPLIVLDTTPKYNFSPAQDTDEINYNHGIHGVQDMCNLLKRNRKEFFLEAGHWEKSDVLDRVAGCVRAIKLAEQIRKAAYKFNEVVNGCPLPILGLGGHTTPNPVDSLILAQREISEGCKGVVFGRKIWS